VVVWLKYVNVWIVVKFVSVPLVPVKNLLPKNILPLQ
jgi:hypothetical protein